MALRNCSRLRYPLAGRLIHWILALLSSPSSAWHEWTLVATDELSDTEPPRSSGGPRPQGIREVAEAVETPGGYQAVQLRVAEQYVEKLGLAGQEERHDDRADHRG